jgi:hypothetical protein
MGNKFKHKINLFGYWSKTNDLEDLTQIVNIYEHDWDDFTRNYKAMVKHYRKHLGQGSGMFAALGQEITFRVYKDQEPMALPLFNFMINYIMVMPKILLGLDMREWEPWMPVDFTSSGWTNEINKIIVDCRPYCTSDEMCEYLAEIKYQLNQTVVETADILAHSISNNEFIALMQRDEESRKSITCTFDIPEDATPDVLEKLAFDRTKKLLDTMIENKDLSSSIYALNGLYNPGQAREFFVHMGYKPDLMGNTIPYSANTNMLMGTEDIRAHVSDARGGRKAELLKLRVSDAGDFERAVSTLMSGIRYVDQNYNCDSQYFRDKKIKTFEDLRNIDGRVINIDGKYYIVNPRDKRARKLIGKTVHMKTSISCTHPKRHEGVICSACYGKLLASINNDIHIGRNSALNDSDEIQQQLLSAKHSLTTKTTAIEFTESFSDFFTYDNCIIGLNSNVVGRVRSSNEYDCYYLEIDPITVTKHMDGENRHFDKSVQEIVVYNSKTGDRITISEEHGLRLYIHPYINEEFYYKQSIKNPDEPVLIPFRQLVDQDLYDTIFEYQYKNFEIADPLIALNKILDNGTTGISRYKTYNECLDDVIPMFNAGGIVIPDIHIELLIACLLFDKDMKAVDWTRPDTEYKFYSIDTAIKHNPSVITSMLYKEANKQIAGHFGTYQKTGTSIYDVFLEHRQPEKKAD